MTKKQQYTFLGLFFLFLTISAGYLSWNIDQVSCMRQIDNIQRMTDNQNDRLFDYYMFKEQGFNKDSLLKFKQKILVSESPIKKRIEFFKKTCERRHKRELVYMLDGWELYVSTKEVLFSAYLKHEKKWGLDLMPQSEYL